MHKHDPINTVCTIKQAKQKRPTMSALFCAGIVAFKRFDHDTLFSGQTSGFSRRRRNGG
jgi:hypothetical protein